MIQRIFLWFYCLTIAEVLVIIIVASAVYLFLRNQLSNRRYWNSVTGLLFVAWLVIITSGTLTDRISGMVLIEPKLVPFSSYYAVITGANKEILRSNFMNMVLFYPAGLFACELLPKDWGRVKKVILTVVLFALLSAGIEVCQYRFALGQAEVDDVIHNTLGTLIGAVVSSIHISGHKLKSSD